MHVWVYKNPGIVSTSESSLWPVRASREPLAELLLFCPHLQSKLGRLFVSLFYNLLCFPG